MSGPAFLLALVAFGGGLGCVGRFAVREILAARGVTAPVVILAVNLLGAAAAGAVLGWSPGHDPTLRAFALAVLSGWTTYSAFAADVVAAAGAGRLARAAVLWIGTVLLTPPLALLAARLAGGFGP